MEQKNLVRSRIQTQVWPQSTCNFLNLHLFSSVQLLSHVQVVVTPWIAARQASLQNAGLDKAQPGIKIARRNINNFRYADDTTLMAESEEELKSLLKVKEKSEKTGLILGIQKTLIMVSGPITSWQIDGETMKQWPYFRGLQNHCRWWLQPWN